MPLDWEEILLTNKIKGRIYCPGIALKESLSGNSLFAVPYPSTKKPIVKTTGSLLSDTPIYLTTVYKSKFNLYTL